jgi:magnesium transporter
MSVIGAAVYDDTGRLVRRLEELSPSGLQLGEGQFAWIGLYEPDEAELRVLQERFDLHPLAVEDALHSHQLPKIDVYGDQLFVVARTAQLEGELIVLGETDIFVGLNQIITVRHGSARGHGQLRDQLEAAPTQLRHGVDYILHAVLDYIVDGYFPVVEGIEEAVLAMERRALDSFLSRGEVSRIFSLRGELMRFRRLLGPMEEVASRLEHHAMPCIDAEVMPYFRDVRDHVRRIAAMADASRDVLSTVFEASLLLEQQRQGEITRRLAAWAAILAVPTAIAGIYGMNFEFMPELHWKLGYPLAILVIVAVCTGLYVRLKRANWL